MASRAVRPSSVPIRAGLGLDLSRCTGMQPPPRKDHWMAAASHAPKVWEKNALTLPKSTSRMLLEAQCLRRVSTQRVQPHILFAEQKRGPFGPREIKGSVQDLVAASCHRKVGSIQTPKVCLSQQEGAGRAPCCGTAVAVCPNNSPVQRVLAGRKISLLICMKAGWKNC